jgi:two-component system cell cycle sensor histidine kinase/response regulator CckA
VSLQEEQRMTSQGNIRVLIAENDHLVSEMVRALLEELDYVVIGEAADGIEAIEMAQSLSPDVILMDIRMPDMDGLEATRRIQKRRPTPVVVLTAYETEELVKEASAAGVGAYLVKPPEAREVARAITIAIARFDDMMALRQSNQRLEITLAELKAAQGQLVQQERIAAVGRLAAGIAHEFNNLMAAVILYADLVLETSDLKPVDRERLVGIRQQGCSAADLVQQILDFGRKAVLHCQDLALVPFIEELSSSIQRMLPGNIKVHLIHEPDEKKQKEDARRIVVNADPGRLQQAMVNLALNARDAMPTGGNLYLRLSHLHLEPGEPSPSLELQPGRWVCLAMTDTGTGIPPEVLPYIFDPFFTTRTPLHSGLGLSQTYGIVKQHGGHIDVSTKMGDGTSVTVYLPESPTYREKPPAPEMVEMPVGNEETVLVIEDNPAMQKALTEGLEMLNYRVLTAVNGQQALALFEKHSSEIALVLSEVSAPEPEGIALLHVLLRRHGDVRLVVLSNYALEDRQEGLVLPGVAGWLRKPVKLERLAEVMAQALK